MVSQSHSKILCFCFPSAEVFLYLDGDVLQTDTGNGETPWQRNLRKCFPKTDVNILPGESGNTYVSICFLLVKTCPSLKSPRFLYMRGWRKYKRPSIMESLIANFLDILGLNFLPLVVSLLPQILGDSENNSVSLHVRTWLILHGTWYTVATLCRPATEWIRRLGSFLHVVCCDGHTWKGKCQHF